MAAAPQTVSYVKPYLVPLLIAISIGLALYLPEELGLRKSTEWFIIFYVPLFLGTIGIYLGIKLKMKGQPALSYGSVLLVGIIVIVGFIWFINWIYTMD